MESPDSAQKIEEFKDFDDPAVYGLAALAFVGILIYYWPLLTGSADVYFSDLTYFFEPFCLFVRNNFEKGILALWNPMIFAGMPQVAMPSPGLLYPFSWFMFALPFSCGLACYMIFHQLLAGLGAFLYFRDLKSSKAASIFGAIAVCLCAYNFSFVRNCTLPASMAWLPLSLYFERNIRFPPANSDSLRTAGGSPAHMWSMIGLAICVSMMMHVGRPEVGAPELILIGLASISKPILSICTKGKAPPEWRSSFCKLASIALGLGLALPTIVPGIEWTALSPRAQGMAPKWVFTWSANWYDFLGMILSNPYGDLCRLDHHTMQFRQMVLSRGGHIPFLSSAYVSPLVVTFAIFGLFTPRTKFKLISIALLFGLSIMAAGRNTPFAPALVSLSPFLATFRYPVKLMFFPCLLLILLAVMGMDLVLQHKLPRKPLVIIASIWLTVLLISIPLAFFPEIGSMASHWTFLFSSPPAAALLKESQFLMAKALQAACVLGLLACWMTHLATTKKLSTQFISSILGISLIACLVQSSLIIENYTKGGFYNLSSQVADRIKQFRASAIPGTTSFKDDSRQAAREQNPTDAFRVLNLYFDPLSVPAEYHKLPDNTTTENFFCYARELLLYQTIMDFDLCSSYGYEAAETADYKTCFNDTFSASSQCLPEPGKRRTAPASDAPIYRFASLTATKFVNTQIYKRYPQRDYPLLDARYFHLLDENKDLNYRIYLVKNARPRAYFAGQVCYVESFKDLQTAITTKHENVQTQALESPLNISYLLNRDRQKHLQELMPIEVADRNSKAEVKITSDNGQQIDLDLNTASSRLLILADHFYPGWIAELDGNEIEILKANLLNRAVIIPAGAHHLRFTYRPRSLLIGFVGAALSLCGFLIFYLLIRGRKSQRDPAST